MAACLLAVTQPVAGSSGPACWTIADAGGGALFLPLLQGPSHALQVTGLRLLGQFGGPSGSGGGGVGGGGGGGQQHAAGFWVAVQRAVQGMELTSDIREALLEWIEGPLQHQVGWGGWVEWSACRICRLCLLQALYGVMHAIHTPTPTQAITLLLAAIAKCQHHQQRLSTLHDLVHILDPPSPTPPPHTLLATLIQQPGWQDTLLHLLTNTSACTIAATNPSTSAVLSRSGGLAGGPGWRWRGPEARAVQSLLTALHVYCVRHVQYGWQHVQYTLCALRGLADKGEIDGWDLAHEVWWWL